MAFFSLASLRSILATETDADSAGSEELLGQLRENWEALTMLAFDTGVSGTVDSVSTTTLTDTGNFAGVDVHNGHTLLITSGVCIGNTYTIDDTTVDTLVCTGDNLETDGVVATDTYKVFYDLKVNTDGHDHDGINSAEVVLADDQVTQAKIAASAVGQAQLKTTLDATANTGGMAGSGGTGAFTIPGGQYAFVYQLKSDGSTDCSGFDIAPSLNGVECLGTSFVQRLNVVNNNTATRTVTCQVRYVSASGPLNWLYLLRDKITGANGGEFFQPDHCCWGNTKDPDKMPHPFGNYDKAKYDLIIIHPTDEELKQARILKEENEELGLLEAFWELYEIDSAEEAQWPDDVDVSIGIDTDWNTGEKTVRKQKIKKPADAKYYQLKLKDT